MSEDFLECAPQFLQQSLRHLHRDRPGKTLPVWSSAAPRRPRPRLTWLSKTFSASSLVDLLKGNIAETLLHAATPQLPSFIAEKPNDLRHVSHLNPRRSPFLFDFLQVTCCQGILLLQIPQATERLQSRNMITQLVTQHGHVSSHAFSIGADGVNMAQARYKS